MNPFCSEESYFKFDSIYPEMWHVSISVDIKAQEPDEYESGPTDYVRTQSIIMKFILTVRSGNTESSVREIWFRADGSDPIKMIYECFKMARNGKFYNQIISYCSTNAPDRSMYELPVFLCIQNHPDWIQDQIKELITNNHILKIAKSTF